MEDPSRVSAVLKDLKCIQLPSNAQELVNLLQHVAPPCRHANCSTDKRQRALWQQLEALASENDRLRAQNLKLLNQIDGARKESERLRLQNAALARELQGIYRRVPDSSATDALPGEEATAGNSPANDGCLNVDVARRILSTLEELPVYVSYMDADLRRLWFTDFAQDATNKDMLHIETAALQLKMRALETGESQTEDVAIRLPDRGHMVWRVKARPHFTEHGDVVGASMASVNITEQVELKKCLCRLEAEMSARRATEDELHRAMKLTEEAIQAKNVFLAIMSHEIRTPLNGLLGLAEALEASELNAEQKELVSAILSSGVIIADILGDILDLASMEFGMMEFEEHPFSPANLLQDIIKMALAATNEKDVTVASEVAADVPNVVVCDPLRVRQVMKYLVLNAIKFTQKGTVSICMGVKSDPIGEMTCSEEKKGDAKITECLQDVKEEEVVSGAEFQQVDSSLGCLSKSSDSLIGLLDTTLFQMRISESSRICSYGMGCSVDASNNTRDLRGNTEQLNSPTEEGGFIPPSNAPMTSQSRQWVEASAGHEGALKHAGCDAEFAAEDSDKFEDDFSDWCLLYCEITDTGVGIPKEAFGTLFDKFTQVNAGLSRNYGGTGLGLAICKQLVELMGGQLTVESEVGKGSKFTFTVKCKVSVEPQIGLTDGKLEGTTSSKDKADKPTPQSFLLHAEKASTSAPEADSVSRVENNTRANPKILLAEDNKVNVMVAISMLKRLGFTAEVVANGVEALEAIRREKYDLILLDICMPLMDGLQVAYAVRKFEETGQWPDEDLCNMFSSPTSRSEESGNTVVSDAQIKKGMDGLANALVDLTKSDQGNRIPIVAITANALRSEIDKCFACGVDAFIAKPVVFQKLQQILERYLPQQSLP